MVVKREERHPVVKAVSRVGPLRAQVEQLVVQPMVVLQKVLDVYVVISVDALGAFGLQNATTSSRARASAESEGSHARYHTESNPALSSSRFFEQILGKRGGGGEGCVTELSDWPGIPLL